MDIHWAKVTNRPDLLSIKYLSFRGQLKLCTCQWYADQTMVQTMNIANKCKFAGLRWLESKKAHYDWCFNANPPFNAMLNEIDIRKKMLKGC